MDEAYDYYNQYAYKKGFSVRKGAIRKSEKDGNVIGRRLHCSKEGYREERFKKTEGSKKRHRGETRCGCKAKLLVNKNLDGSWVVSMFVEEHNHVLATPRKCHLLPSHRKIKSQGSRNVGFIELDARNYMRTRRKIEFSVGDSQRLLNYLNEIQIKNPHFFYAIQLDDDGKLTSIFWCDARCRMDYSYFGDVVCLDPTYGTNKYAMSFVPIVGVNHHLQTVLFGCALIFDETEYSFIWVLEKWLQAMKESHPKVILTDQDSAISGAIAKVLPCTIHRYCLWHIFQNAKRHLGRLFTRGSKFGQDLSYCVPVYSHEFFCADMCTTQRSESINKFFKGFLSRKMLLLEFVQGVDKALIRRREKEIEADFKMNNMQPSLILHMPIKEEASKLYTPAIFAKFQEELLGSLRYKCEKIEENGYIASYKCWIPEKQVRLVKMCSESSFFVRCSCCKFEFAGFLCRHILKVFIVANVDKIPREYMLNHWTRDAKCGKFFDEEGQEVQEDCYTYLTLRYSTLSHEAKEVATKGSCSTEVYKVALHWLRKTREEVEKAVKMQMFEVPNNNIDKCLSQQTIMSTEVTIRDPPLAKCKGNGGRKKAFWEKNLKKRKTKVTMGKNSQITLAQASKDIDIIILVLFMFQQVKVLNLDKFLFVMMIPIQVYQLSLRKDCSSFLASFSTQLAFIESISIIFIV
ncbi:FHY3/FAR1 family protein [Dioscorea alata]|uniref:FHY3/FAR1 family protein n=1 Tax=Dioscorea alata TaxID=55571 RepID=A0ACB7VAC0_DIOAL|nr:FHY3/FAR1 family protein [Dioscorea alata]